MAKVKYECEKCNMIYGKEDAAIECEKRHYSVIGTEAVYQKHNKKEYPHTIVVILKDDYDRQMKVTYYREQKREGY